MAYRVVLAGEDDFDGWRRAVRGLVAAGIAPDQVCWQVGQGTGDLFGADPLPTMPEARFRVARDYVDMAQRVILHRDPERFALLHGLLLRVLEQPLALRDRSDRRTDRLVGMEQTIRRDMHKMRAFVRFRAFDEPDGPRHVAWFEPEHHILRANADFFLRRFAGMRWSILTPDLSIHWDGSALQEGPGASRKDAQGSDPVEGIWKAYFAAIFNPARLKTGAMLREMPRRYWANMPETALVPQLIESAFAREQAMIAASEAGERPSRRRHATVSPPSTTRT